MNKHKHEILEILDYISSQNRSLNLITNVRGVPIHLAASIIRSSQTSGTVRLRADRQQIVSLKTAEKILVQSELLPFIVIGEVDLIDLHAAFVTLSNLRYVIGSMGNRKNLRVQPENPIHAEVILGHGYSVLGEMIDISIEGLSVHLAKDDFPQDNLFVLQIPVEIRLGLPVTWKSSIHDINVQAVIAYTNESQQNYRVGLLTYLKDPDLRILRRYIFDRQTEILNEIQKMNNPQLEIL